MQAGFWILHDRIIDNRCNRIRDHSLLLSLPLAMASPNFTPRTAIVTGAAQGIGHAIALRLADDGLDIVLNDIQGKSDALSGVAHEISKRGRKALAVIADCTQETEVQRLVDEAVKEFGRLDVMIANTGFGGKGGINTGE